MTTPTESPHDDQQDLHDKMVRSHILLVNRILAELQSDAPLTASLIREARQFLRDNGITQELIDRERRQHEALSQCWSDLPFPVPGMPSAAPMQNEAQNEDAAARQREAQRLRDHQAYIDSLDLPFPGPLDLPFPGPRRS